MFCTSVESFADDEQKKVWMPEIMNFNILGCYAQTEIGHGSDVASLKTTATYDMKTDEFVLNTPSIDATKWWPGEMGRLANFACVFARLVIPDPDSGDVNDYGIAPFLCQIRDRDTHKHMPGIKTGDMGPKFGYGSKDNGWMTLDNVRIPRS
jgi:acyl-CoA oxidase